MLTAHDFPSAQVAEAAGMDIILIGDSLAMVAMGLEDTSEIVVDDIILHCRSVARGAKAAFKVSNLVLSLLLFI
jgi:3-methyl-2-oxobutanoate hydroxymethyltransferase